MLAFLVLVHFLLRAYYFSTRAEEEEEEKKVISFLAPLLEGGEEKGVVAYLTVKRK